jgi:hypothetical protein
MAALPAGTGTFRRAESSITDRTDECGPDIPARDPGYQKAAALGGGSGVPDVVDLARGYQRLFLGAQPTDGDDAIHKAIMVVFTDLPPDRAKESFDDVLQDLGVPSYVDDGFVMGGFYESSEGTSIYNSSFLPFTSPVPFLLIRQAVISDWKFFVDNSDNAPEFDGNHLTESIRGCHLLGIRRLRHAVGQPSFQAG